MNYVTLNDDNFYCDEIIFFTNILTNDFIFWNINHYLNQDIPK